MWHRRAELGEAAQSNNPLEPGIQSSSQMLSRESSKVELLIVLKALKTHPWCGCACVHQADPIVLCAITV